jgi:hypothetical protein
VNLTAPAAFVAFLVGGILVAIGASLGFWLIDRLSAHFSHTEIDDLDTRTREQWVKAECALRHPSTRKDES